MHRFDNLDAGDARALVTLTPAVAGKRYFEDIAAVVNAGGAARHGEGESGHGQIRADRSVSGPARPSLAGFENFTGRWSCVGNPTDSGSGM